MFSRLFFLYFFQSMVFFSPLQKDDFPIDLNMPIVKREPDEEEVVKANILLKHVN